MSIDRGAKGQKIQFSVCFGKKEIDADQKDKNRTSIVRLGRSASGVLDKAGNH